VKILLIFYYPPPIHGATVAGKYLKDSALLNSKFNCKFINLGTSNRLDEIGRGGFRKVKKYLMLILRVTKQLFLFKPGLCYLTPSSHGIGFYKDFVIIAIVKLFNKKIVCHFHNKGVSKRQDRFFDNLLYRFVFQNANVILLSNLLYPDIRKYVPEERVYYCPNGIPDFKGSGNEVFINIEGITRSNEIEILFFSHLIKSKGVLLLIEACELLHNNGIYFHCTIAGGDAELTRTKLEAIIFEKGLTTTIKVLGQINFEDKGSLISSADIFVLPSFNDCLPLVLLEAMQHFLPIVSTFEGAIPDVVDDGITGFLVPKHDVYSLAEKLKILIKDPILRREMGQAGRAKYEREFALSIFETRMVEILEEINCKS
jgi:glycosyltransferase involved in cell wall biosynthesis